VFAQRFRDLIQFTFLTAAPTDPNYFNVAAANASGVEATLRVRPRGPVQGSVSYTHLATKVTDAGFDSGDAATFVEGERLLRRPDDAVTVRADATLAERFQLGARVLWVGSRDDIRFALFPAPSRRVTLPSYTTLDLSATATVLRGHAGTPGLDLTARVENLFGEDYEQVVGFPARGRGVFVGAATTLR
jgi:outer membrane cobalamin receptor